MTNHVLGAIEDRKFALKRLEGFAWGLFFVWIGIVLLEELGWGVALLGVGTLTLGGQLARKWIAATFETFWVVVGTLFFLGGLWTLLGFRISLIPIVSIVAGAALLVSAVLSRPGRGSQN